MSFNSILSKVARLWLVDSNQVPTQLDPRYVAQRFTQAGTGFVPTVQNDGSVAWQQGGGSGGSGTVTNVTTTIGGFTFGSFTSTTPILSAQNVGAFPDLVYLSGNGSWAQPVASFRSGAGGSQRVGDIALLAGNNVTITDNGDNSFTINASGGGGGGSFDIVSVVWSTGGTNKNAYTAPSVVNNAGLVFTLHATSDPGVLSSASIVLNSAALATTYTISGNFPNYSVAVPVGDVTGLPVQTASTVTVVINLDSKYSLTANSLTNTQPVPFTSTLSVSYVNPSVPYYATTSSANYSYVNVGTATTYSGTINGVSAPNASGTLAGLSTTGLTIAGSVTGTGTAGAGSRTVSLSGSVGPETTFVPAFYNQTANSTIPTFTTGSSQTSAAAAGSTITYPSATDATQYNWVVTNRALANLKLVNAFGQVPLSPDVTSSQVLSGISFNIFGWTNLGVGTQSVLVIS